MKSYWIANWRKYVTVVYFDLETAGVEDYRPDIQLAAVAVDGDWNEVGSIEMKVQFDIALADPEALRINHYDTAVWREQALPLPAVIARFGRFLDNFKTLQRISKRSGRPYRVAQLAGHNAATFDAPRLKSMYTRAGVFLGADPRVLEPCSLRCGGSTSAGWNPRTTNSRRSVSTSASLLGTMHTTRSRTCGSLCS